MPWEFGAAAVQSGGTVGADARQDGAQARPRLLVVEDDPNILELLSASLRFAGFDVSDRDQRQRRGQRGQGRRPDLVVLDVMLPDLDGFEVIRLHARGRRPYPGGLPDRPRRHRRQDPRPDPGRRRLRHQAVQPRGADRPDPGGAAPHRSGDEPPSRLTFADLELDEETHEVYRAGQRVQLSPTEFKLLRYLMLNANRVLSKAQILDHVWNYDFRGDDNIVESYISYLRRKVDNVQPRLIHTLRGVGYVLRKPAARDRRRTVAVTRRSGGAASRCGVKLRRRGAGPGRRGARR